MEAVFIAAGLVFVAELGDKSQLMAMTFATRYRARTVLLGMGIASTLLSLLSALIGDVAGRLLPDDVVRIVAGVVFLVFAALTLWSARKAAADDEPVTVKPHDAWAVVTVGIAFALAELGDKTMVTTMALSTQYSWWWVWVGSAVGMFASIVLAVIVGRQLLKVIPVHAVHLVAAALFAALGVWLLVA